MSSELESLYQEIILEHSRYPRNYGRLPQPTHHAEGYNPLCGDQVHLTLQVDGEAIRDIRFEGQSCAICKASASVMTSLVKGLPLSEVEQLYEAFHALLTAEEPPTFSHIAPKYQDYLLAFGAVRNYPMRVKCATLPWHTLHAALHESHHELVSTENL
jgi:nitrogen fixation NifU-like protein